MSENNFNININEYNNYPIFLHLFALQPNFFSDSSDSSHLVGILLNKINKILKYTLHNS